MMRSLNEVLTAEAPPVDDVLGALREVEKTYRAVMDAITRFIAPAVEAGPVPAASYLEMERGVLTSDIEEGRGHCLRIITFYKRVGGLREWLELRLEPRRLDELDAVFARRGTADGDLSAQLVEVGRVLTNEARVIVNLLLTGQHSAARRRIIEGRRKLQPLEEAIREAQADLRALATSLGFTLR